MDALGQGCGEGLVVDCSDRGAPSVAHAGARANSGLQACEQEKICKHAMTRSVSQQSLSRQWLCKEQPRSMGVLLRRVCCGVEAGSQVKNAQCHHGVEGSKPASW